MYLLKSGKAEGGERLVYGCREREVVNHSRNLSFFFFWAANGVKEYDCALETSSGSLKYASSRTAITKTETTSELDADGRVRA